MKTRLFGLLLLGSYGAYPAVVKIDLVDRSEVENGYERIVAKAHFTVDPKLARNQIVADIALAPRNAQGLVEFTSDVFVLRPMDPAKGNGTALVEISNRGRKGLLNTFDFADASFDPKTPSDFGDGFLLKQGFTLVWVGWQFDVPKEPGMLHLNAPIATDHGKTIVGMVRSEWIGDSLVKTINLADRAMIAYPVADPNAPGTEMTVRDHVADPRKIVPRSQWSFSGDRHATLSTGFVPGKIYEVIYQAKDPVVVGLGPAAIRDMVSFLKHGGADTLLGDEHQSIKRALGFGVSQSGRFLRQFLYDGFNADEQSRIVFDGVWAHVAGAGRGSFNFRFAQPSRDGNPFTNVLYPTDVPPFTEDGLLERVRKDGVEPKIFFSNGSYEYWGRAASLITTTPDGKRDVAPDAKTRIYFFAGSQHGPGSIPPHKVEAENLSAVNDYRYAQRALLLKMQAWLEGGAEPPPSVYPRVGKDQLVSVGALAFPRIEGVHVPPHKRTAYRLDFSTEPPKMGPPFTSLVPQVDPDGNELGGIRMPEIAVPLATNTGWDLRSKAIGAPDEMLNFIGSYIPFPRTKSEREERKDPRMSVSERYPSKREYLDKITAAAEELVRDGYLLESDVPKLTQRAGSEWDYVLTLN